MSCDYDYWKETLEISLEAMNKLHLFSDEELDLIAGDIQVSAENKRMAFGEDCIPNPSQTRIDELEKRMEKKTQESEEEFSKKRNEYEEVISRPRIKLRNLEYKIDEKAKT